MVALPERGAFLPLHLVSETLEPESEVLLPFDDVLEEGTRRFREDWARGATVVVCGLERERVVAYNDDVVEGRGREGREVSISARGVTVTLRGCRGGVCALRGEVCGEVCGERDAFESLVRGDNAPALDTFTSAQPHHHTEY